MTDEIWERIASDHRHGVVETYCITSGKLMKFGPVPAQRRRRRYSLSAALRQAAKAGTPVAAAVAQPDGGIALTFGEATVPSDTVENEWDKIGKLQ